MPIKLTIYEDNHDLRESLTILLRGFSEFELLGAYENCADILKNTTEKQPDVILMDIDMPIKNGLEGLKIIKENFPNINVLMLTVFEDNENVFQAICQGAVGYLLKRTPPHKLIEAIKEAYEGGSPMTPTIARKVLQLFANQPINKKSDYQLTNKEKEVLTSLVDGKSYKMIAADHFISLETVRSHIKKIYEKLQVHSQSEAVAKALKERIV